VRPIDVFHIGPQKAASTWMYSCLREHPQIACASKEDLYYLDMNWHRGRDWYLSHFAGAGPNQLLVDFTCTYLRCPQVPERMAEENPGARIIVCLRDPVERAFSHYWHEKKRGRIAYRFSEVLTNYDLFSSWLETGFYARHVGRLLEHFPRDRILCQLYDVLEANPRTFLREALEFLSVDSDFEPSVLERRVNVAGHQQGPLNLALHKVRRGFQELGLGGAVQALERRFPALSGKSEYLRGIPPELEATLRRICEPEIERTEKLLGLDLSAWREPAALRRQA
jgi:hypothetical protein